MSVINKRARPFLSGCVSLALMLHHRHPPLISAIISEGVLNLYLSLAILMRDGLLGPCLSFRCHFLFVSVYCFDVESKDTDILALLAPLALMFLDLFHVLFLAIEEEFLVVDFAVIFTLLLHFFLRVEEIEVE